MLKGAPSSYAPWRMCWRSIIASIPTRKCWYASMGAASNRLVKPVTPCLRSLVQPGSTAMNSSDRGLVRRGGFIMLVPWDGWRRVEITEPHPWVDWAQIVKKLVDEDYADRERKVLVMDDPNTYDPASMYEAFDPAEARRIAQRPEIQYTRKHGSWLNMADGTAGSGEPVPGPWIPSREILAQEFGTWQTQRNRQGTQADWRFASADSRIKLKSPYPSLLAWLPINAASPLRTGFCQALLWVSPARFPSGLCVPCILRAPGW